MAEHIGCRNCGSPNCKGCNIYTLATMLENGKFDCLMNGNRSINPAADVVVQGEWEIRTDDYDCELMCCSVCKAEFYDGDNDTVDQLHNYCPNCGADMRRDTNG